MYQSTRIDKEGKLVLLIPKEEKTILSKTTYSFYVSLDFLNFLVGLIRGSRFPSQRIKTRKPNPFDKLIIALDLKPKI